MFQQLLVMLSLAVYCSLGYSLQVDYLKQIINMAKNDPTILCIINTTLADPFENLLKCEGHVPQLAHLEGS